MTSEIALESTKIQIKWKDFLNGCISIFLVMVVAVLAVMPFSFAETLEAHDIRYHFDAIRSLNEAWGNGTFGSKIYGLIAQDYGYGTGLFYSMLPASLCVIFMNVLNLSCSSALTLEFFLIFALSGVVVYFFSRRIFKKNLAATVCALVYTAFPYFLAEIYVRFAFSEVFLMLASPLIFWGIYELIEKSNYRAFLALFTLGFSLAIFLHFTMSIMIALVVLIYICLNFKKFISNYRWVPFLVSCGLVLIITAIFYIPMLLNYGIVDISVMASWSGLVYSTTVDMFGNHFLIPSAILTIVVYVIFCAVHFNRPKEERKAAKNLFILASFLVWFVSPFFPWIILNFAPFTTIQFAWRNLIMVGLAVALMAGYITKYLNEKVLKYGFLIGLCIILPVMNINQSARQINDGGIDLDFGVSVNSCLSYDFGMGGSSNGDYLPTGATSEYLFSRANDSMVLDTNVEVLELANYQTINQLSFIINLDELGAENGYVVLNIPYSVCEGLDIHEMATDNSSESEISTLISSENIGGTDCLKINFQATSGEEKIIINYADGGVFDNYLIENPFEFVVVSGEATFTNFVKSGIEYTVEITTAETTQIELPTLYYKGYTLTYTTANGSYTLEAVHGENGFVEIVVSESGTLSVKFTATYVTVSSVISIIGVVMFALVLLAVLIIPRKYFKMLGDWVTSMFKKYKILGEIVRFVIVGGIATVIDMFTMGVVMYAMQPEIYESFINVFINTPSPSTLATLVGTAAGFVVGLVVNYILSIFFVFNEKGNSRTAKGFMVFVGLSTIGLFINILGTYVGYDLLKINQWLVKIIMVLIVLVYNYISKRLILFKKKAELSTPGEENKETQNIEIQTEKSKIDDEHDNEQNRKS